MQQAFHTTPITHVAGAICDCLGVEPPQRCEGNLPEVTAQLQSLANGAIDRVLVYNPDAIARWAYEKYYDTFAPVRKYCPISVEMLSMMPPKTPVCFASMYTGASPEVHGITHYTKPTLQLDSVFDTLIRAGKKCAIVTVRNQSMHKLFLGRDMDYYPCANDAEVIRVALDVIRQDKHDLICVYNQEYDDVMHRSHPNSLWSRRALKHYCASFEQLAQCAETNWTSHNTALLCATDHGTHREWYLLGNHGKDIPKDRNILHFWGMLPKRG